MITGNLPFRGDNRQEVMNKIIKKTLYIPAFISREAESLLKGLFKRNPHHRLGHGSNGAQEIKDHPFFASIDWQRLYERKIAPPFKPDLKSKDITQYFDSEFTKKTPRDSIGRAPEPEVQQIFRGFDYTSAEMEKSQIKTQVSETLEI